MFCKVCGKELSDSAIFCGNCGAKIEREFVAENATEVAETVTEAVTEEVAEVVEAVEGVAEEATAVVEEEIVAPVEEAVEAVTVAEPVVEVPTAEEIAAVKEEAKVAKEEFKAAKEDIKAAKAEIKEAKAEAKAERKRLMVKRNTVLSSITCVLGSLVVTAVMFATAAVAVLCTKEFDDFYYGFIINNRVDFDAFWILTSIWYLYALITVLVLLVLLVLSLIKRRKYAIFNYIGIPMIINGVIFAFMALLNKWIVKTFDLPVLLEELFEVIGDEARNTVLFAGVILLAAGILFVLLYVLTATIHKAVYRKKCMKADVNK